MRHTCAAGCRKGLRMSLFEMIPDRPLVVPSGGHGERPQVNKRIGLREKVCAYCGETFYRRKGEREYIRHRNGKELHFCTWSHTCRWEEETPKAERVKRPKKRMDEAQKQARIDQLMRDMSKIRAKLDSEAGRALSGAERNKMYSGIRWRVHELKKLLEGLDDTAIPG